MLLLGTLVAAAALKASDQVLRYSIDKATVELLYLPVPAAETFRVKSFIDTVVYRLGDALGGLAVLLFAAVLRWSPVQMSWVGVVLVGRVAGGGGRGAPAVRREPAREHPSAPRRRRARGDAGDGSRRHRADLVAAEGHARSEIPLRAAACSRWRTTGRCIRRFAALLQHESPEVRAPGAGAAGARR